LRPLQLTIEGFTCFRQRQGPIDLSELELFAITGVTGAGKSSLLDAMIFALYGKVPRVGKGYGELISLGRERMAVTLDFRLGDRTFRVTRIGKRKGAPQAILEVLVGGGTRPLTEGVRGVDDTIEGLLGLSYEAFTQAVILPQGDFAKFLRSEPGKRRAILRDLLRHQVYERMRKSGAEEQRRLEHEVQTIEERLTTDYTGATPEAVASLEREIEEQNAANDRLRGEFEAAQITVARAKAGYEKTRELRQRRGELDELASRELEILAEERRLNAARRAAPVIVGLEAASRANGAAVGAERELAEAQTVLKGAQARHEHAVERLTLATAGCERIPELDRRMRELDGLRGVVDARERARRRLAQIQERLKKAETTVAAARKDADAARSRLETLERDEQAALKALTGLAYDGDRHRMLEDARDAATTVVKLREDAVTARRRAEETTKQRAESEAKAARAREQGEAARRRRERAVKACNDARTAHLEGVKLHSAAELRGTLRPGEKCPVCEQPVHDLPTAIEAPELKELSRQVAERQAAMNQADDDARTADAEAAGMQAAAEQTGNLAARALEEAKALVTRLEEAAQALDRSVGALVAEESGASVEERTRAALARLAKLRERFDRVRSRHDELQRALAAGRHELEKVEGQLAAGEREVAESSSAASEATHEVVEYEAKIKSVTLHLDPAAEREELAADASRLEAERKNAQSDEAAKRAELAAAEAHAKQANSKATELRAAADVALRQVRAASAEAGFADLEAARAAALGTADQQQLETRVREHASRRGAAQTRIGELEAELGGSEIQEHDLRAAEEHARGLRDAHETGVQTAAALEERIKDLRRKTKAAAKLIGALEATREQQKLHTQLAHDLRGDAFQAYLLQEVFREMVKGASARLWNLSGRYTFTYQEDAFHVLDHDNARDRRSAETLSGGETFLASLALALELSEQVQRSAGAVILDSIFIDEGFGTLDSETLDTVAGAIESLPVGGRMVGIITHVAALSERLPACVVVEKVADGSRVTGLTR